MKRTHWATLNAVTLTGMSLLVLAAWVPPGAMEPRIVTPTPAPWQQITLSEAIALAAYVDRDDWQGCETRGTVVLTVRCPDGYQWEIK